MNSRNSFAQNLRMILVSIRVSTSSRSELVCLESTLIDLRSSFDELKNAADELKSKEEKFSD